MNPLKSIKNLLIFTLLLINLPYVQSENLVERIYPLHWWSGMANPRLQLMIYGKNISGFELKTENPYAEVMEIHKTSNSNYLFIDLLLKHGVKTRKSFITVN